MSEILIKRENSIDGKNHTLEIPEKYLNNGRHSELAGIYLIKQQDSNTIRLDYNPEIGIIISASSKEGYVRTFSFRPSCTENGILVNNCIYDEFNKKDRKRVSYINNNKPYICSEIINDGTSTFQIEEEVMSGLEEIYKSAFIKYGLVSELINYVLEGFNKDIPGLIKFLMNDINFYELISLKHRYTTNYLNTIIYQYFNLLILPECEALIPKQKVKS